MQHAHTGHTAFLCSGDVWPATGGSWIGHVLPGVFLVSWGLHWFISATFQSLTGTARKRYGGAAYHKVVFFPPQLQDIEPFLKVVLPAIAIILEFSLSGTRYLRCPPGTAKAGELDVAHMNSWSHGTNYPPIILSGLVDLIHTFWVPLPQGIPQFFLSAAFGSSGYLMLAHTKGEPLDGLLHQLLGCCMVAVAVVVLVQGASPRGSQSYGLNAAKSLAIIMEGCWFFAITHIMFSSDATWQASHPGDMTRVMFTPVMFTWIFLGVITFLLLLYLAMHVLLLGPYHRPSSSKHAHPKVLPTSSGEDDSDDVMDGLASGCSGDSCRDWRLNRGWKYLKLSQGKRKEGVAVQCDEVSDTPTGSSTSHDAAVELV